MTGVQAECELLVRDSDLLGTATAIFSEARTHRYLLTREWDRGLPRAVFVMLNPSTAGAFEQDPTIGRCGTIARHAGCGSLAVVNLHGLCATDPDELRGHPDPVGQHADAFITEQCRPGHLVIAAWGACKFARPRASSVMTSLADAGVTLSCLAVNKDGSPKHPLYCRGDSPLLPYPAPEAS